MKNKQTEISIAMSLFNVNTGKVATTAYGMPSNPFVGQTAENHGATKGSKRAALSTITNVPRRNPNRACKEVSSTAILAKPIQLRCHKESSMLPFNIHADAPKVIGCERKIQSNVLDLQDTLFNDKVMEVDQPMAASPCDSNMNVDFEGDTEKSSCSSDGDSEYQDDILTYLKEAAAKFQPRVGYMEKQPDINYNMRSILVDWLIEVSEEFSLDNRTLYLAVSYVDRFLSIMSVQRGKLQLVGVASLFIAAKFEEIYPPDATDFVYVTDDTYTLEQLLRMERFILETLGYNVSAPTFGDFLDIFLGAAGCKLEGSELRCLAMYFCELALLDSGKFLTYLPTDIAASAILLASHTLRQPISSHEMILKCGAEVAKLMRCFYDLQVAFRQASSSKYKVVVQKYSENYMNVARIMPILQPFRPMF